MSTLVLGNGESRRGFDTSSYKTLIGCNAIHRDFKVDHLICCDHRMIRESLENPSIHNVPIYVRKDWYQYFRKIQKNKNINLLPEIPFEIKKRADHPDHWGSGSYAVLVAITLGVKEISLVGFDLYGKNKLVNNLYKGTKNYSSENSPAIDPAYWKYQIGELFKRNEDIQFNVINYKEWLMPSEWRYKNVHKQDLPVASNLNTVYTNTLVD
jgi:hypothetical protein